MNLLERLKNEPRQLLNDLKEKNPSSYKMIVREFEKVTSYCDLRFEIIAELAYSRITDSNDVWDVKNLFNQIEIDY